MTCDIFFKIDAKWLVNALGLIIILEQNFTTFCESFDGQSSIWFFISFLSKAGLIFSCCFFANF